MLRASDLISLWLDARRLTALRWAGLAGVGGMSAVVYWFGLVRPFNLDALGLQPHVDVATLTHGHPDVQLNLMLTYAALLVLYYLAWRLCRAPTQHPDGHAPRMWAALLISVATINVLMLSLYPIGAMDVFDYVAQGREISVWHANPFYTPADTFPAEPVLPFTAWTGMTTLYGPGWQLLAAGLTHVAGSDLRANLLAFKSLELLFYAGCIALIAAILRRHAPDRALAGVCLFALNPLVIYETAGNGHNDIVMVFWMLLGFYFLSRDRHSLAALALTAGLLTKFVPAFLLPVVLVHSLRRLPSRPMRIRFLATSGLACGVLVVAVAGVFWRGGDMFSAQRRLGMLTTSLPAAAEALLEPHLGARLAEQWIGQLSWVLTGAAVAATAWYTWRAPGGRPERSEAAWLRPVRASTAVLLFYLLVACLWFQGWYTIWPLGLAVLLPEGVLATSAVLGLAWLYALVAAVRLPRRLRPREPRDPPERATA